MALPSNKRRIRNRAGTRSERGASVVEFALVLPVFLLLLFGIVQYGTIFLVRNQMTEAASDAARVAVSSATLAAAESTATAALAQDVPHDGAGLFALSCGNAAVVCSAQPATGCTAPSGYQCLQVTVSYDYARDPVIDLPLLPVPSTLKATSTVLVGNGSLQQ